MITIDEQYLYKYWQVRSIRNIIKTSNIVLNYKPSILLYFCLKRSWQWQVSSSVSHLPCLSSSISWSFLVSSRWAEIVYFNNISFCIRTIVKYCYIFMANHSSFVEMLYVLHFLLYIFLFVDLIEIFFYIT